MFDSFSFTNMCLVPGHTFRYFTLGAMKHRLPRISKSKHSKLEYCISRVCYRGYVIVL